MKRKSLVKAKSKFGRVEALPSSLKNYFGYCLYKSALRMREKLDSGLEVLGLIAPQLGIMSLLDERGAQSQIEIGDRMTIDRATMVKLINGLQELGFVTRKTDIADRRVNLVMLTSDGNRALRRARQIARVTEEVFLARLSTKEASELKATIAKLME